MGMKYGMSNDQGMGSEQQITTLRTGTFILSTYPGSDPIHDHLP